MTQYPGSQPPKLLDQMRAVLRTQRYAVRTEKAYCDWVRRYVKFHGMRSRADLAEGKAKVEAFLTDLAVSKGVAAATQRQALNALVFLYRDVLGLELGLIGEIEKPKRQQKVPSVLTKEEMRRVLALVGAEQQLVCRLLYGTGLRLLECLRLRIKDVDFGRGEVVVHDGKGGKDRVTMLPESLRESLRAQLHEVRGLHERDLAAGFGEVWLPGAL